MRDEFGRVAVRDPQSPMEIYLIKITLLGTRPLILEARFLVPRDYSANGVGHVLVSVGASPHPPYILRASCEWGTQSCFS